MVRVLDILKIHLFVLHNTDTISSPLFSSRFLRYNKQTCLALTLSVVHNKNLSQSTRSSLSLLCCHSTLSSVDTLVQDPSLLRCSTRPSAETLTETHTSRRSIVFRVTEECRVTVPATKRPAHIRSRAAATADDSPNPQGDNTGVCVLLPLKLSVDKSNRSVT